DVLIRCYLFRVRSYCSHRHLHSFPTRRSSDLINAGHVRVVSVERQSQLMQEIRTQQTDSFNPAQVAEWGQQIGARYFITGKVFRDRKSTRLNSSHVKSSYAVFCLKKKRYVSHE